MTKSIAELAAKYTQTDKFRNAKDGHSYGEFYEKTLSEYQGKRPRVLEIGVARGDSLRIWAEYFPGGQIVGVDKIPVTVTSHSNIQCLQGDFYSGETIRKLQREFGSFDILIDDGPHTIESQLMFIQRYMPLTNPGGVLIIEDVQPNTEAVLQKSIPKICGQQLIDLTKNFGRSDDKILAIRPPVKHFGTDLRYLAVDPPMAGRTGSQFTEFFTAMVLAEVSGGQYLHTEFRDFGTPLYQYSRLLGDSLQLDKGEQLLKDYQHLPSVQGSSDDWSLDNICETLRKYPAGTVIKPNSKFYLYPTRLNSSIGGFTEKVRKRLLSKLGINFSPKPPPWHHITFYARGFWSSEKYEQYEIDHAHASKKAPLFRKALTWLEEKGWLTPDYEITLYTQGPDWFVSDIPYHKLVISQEHEVDKIMDGIRDMIQSDVCVIGGGTFGAMINIYRPGLTISSWDNYAGVPVQRL